MSPWIVFFGAATVIFFIFLLVDGDLKNGTTYVEFKNRKEKRDFLKRGILPEGVEPKKSIIERLKPKEKEKKIPVKMQPPSEGPKKLKGYQRENMRKGLSKQGR